MVFHGKGVPSPTYNNEFDLTERSLSDIKIVKARNGTNCVIQDKNNSSRVYSTFILEKNKRSKYICEISFFPSSRTGKFIPRPIFKRLLNKDGSVDTTRSNKFVVINLSESEKPLRFWEMIRFLNMFKDIVDLEGFENSFSVRSQDDIAVSFKGKSKAERKSILQELIKIADITSDEFNELTFESRKVNLKTFLGLLKNEDEEIEKYRDKFKIRQQGEEPIWHHFLKNNDWLLGLNVDIRFITDFLDEKNIGNSDSSGRGDPQADLLGVSEFTTIVELKHARTEIFKRNKSKGRANTWDFTADFIEAISQCLGQKFELEKSFSSKEIFDNNRELLDKRKIRTVDPRSVLLIGNKKEEFPLGAMTPVNYIKNETFERFRRNNQNIDVLSYDELFERAYHIVFSKKLKEDWYSKDASSIFG